MSNLIPGETLVYERINGVVYAQYRDPPHNSIPKWIIGGDSEAINRAQGNLFSYSDWQDMMTLAKTNHALKTQIDKLVNLYYLVREEQ